MLKTVRKIFLILLLSQLVYIIVLKWIDPPFTLTQLGSLFSGDGLKRDYVSFSEMSSEAGLAVMAAEDQLLPDHHGFDFKNIERALAHNEKKPKKIRGASTISQQVAKNVFLWQGRSWLRKGLEVYFTFMIELIWGKQRILEMYLNVIEMGKGIYGIEAAAQEYFNKPASKLNRTQAAMIAASLPNPKKYTVKPVSRYVSIRSKWVIRQMGFLEGDDGIKGLLGKR
jgi:monofunctional biosynthetic peptidoglycan transglycosylase